MSIITQFPNHVAYRISLLQTAQPAFILKQGREIYFWVDFQCFFYIHRKRQLNAKLVLTKRSPGSWFFHPFTHNISTHQKQLLVQNLNEVWPILIRYTIQFSRELSKYRRYTLLFAPDSMIGDSLSRQMTFCRSFDFFRWPRFFIVYCCSLALTSDPVSFEVKSELYIHI